MNANSSYKIFITYRHEDSQATCDHIYDRLRMRFGRETVFKDVDAIPSGSSFPGVIDNALQKCRVVLVVIGPSWSTVGETKGAYAGQARLNNPEDWVRIEVERALSLAPVNSVGDPASGLLLIPLLVQGASMPLAENLPESLRDLTRRNFIRIRPDPDFNRDIQRLITRIAKWMRPMPLSRRKLLLGAGAIAATATGIGVGIRLTTSRNSPPVIPGTLRWRFPAPAGLRSSPAVAVANGSVYVGAADGTVYALDALSGSKRWSYVTGGIEASSPVFANGLIYVGTQGGILYALDGRTGSVQWNFRTGKNFDYAQAPQLVTLGSAVYMNTISGTVYAIDTHTGTKLWGFETDAELTSSPTVGNGLVYVASDRGLVYVLDAHTGIKQWSFQAPFARDMSTPIELIGRIYVGSQDGSVYILDAASGVKMGTFQTDMLDSGNSDTSGRQLSWPMVAEDMVYLGSGNGFVYAYPLSLRGGSIGTWNATWKFQTGGHISSPPTVANGRIYVGVWEHAVHHGVQGNIYALDASTGTKKWSFQTDGSVYSSPAVADGLVYVGADFVYAINA